VLHGHVASATFVFRNGNTNKTAAAFLLPGSFRFACTRSLACYDCSAENFLSSLKTNIMKNAIFSGNTITRHIRPSVLALLFAGVVNTSFAQAADKPAEAPAEVKYLGSAQGSPLFHIAFNNPLGEEVSVTLRDPDGYTIYADVTKEKTYIRKIRFAEFDFDKVRLTLTLRTKKNVQTQSFEVTRSTRTVEDIAVVSL
jgi:hypothetical protein